MASALAASAALLAFVAVIVLLTWTSPANAAPVHQGPAPNTGTIVIIKQATPADGTDFPFASNVAGYAAFQLDDAAINDGDGVTDTVAMTDTAIGAYVVTEQPPTGWRIANIQCDDDNSVGMPAQGQASIAL